MEEPPETPPPVLPPQDVSQHYHYQPVMDPESEFLWHRPDAQAAIEYPERNVEITDIHDRWQIYRGSIPPMSEHHTEAVVENREEIRQYAWDYQYQEIVGQNQRAPREEEYCPPVAPPIQMRSYQHSEHHSHSEYHSHSEHTDYSQQSTSSYHDQPSHNDHWHHDSSDHFHQDENQHHQNHYDHSPNQSHHTTTLPLPHTTIPVPQYQEQSSQHNDNSKECHYDSFNHKPENFYHSDEHKTLDIHYQIDNLHIHDVPIKNNVEISHVHVQKNTKKRRPRRHRIDLGTTLETSSLVNGDVSESESDYFEDIIPRHPYDGFYLRHRATIDSRGRKVCTHEIPPTPSPTPSPPESPIPQDYDTAEENLTSDTEDHVSFNNLNRPHQTPKVNQFRLLNK